MGASLSSEAVKDGTAAGTPRQGSTIGRAFEIFVCVSTYLLWLMAWRLSLLASTLRRLREEGVRFSIDHDGLPELSRNIVRGASMEALALVTLGLYLAASLLMQHAMGPRLFRFNALACVFYIVAGWFTIRLVRAIGKKI